MTWRIISGYENYEINVDGQVRNRKSGLVLKSYLVIHGYLSVGLWIKCKRKHKKIHRLLAIEFIPNPENKPHINHINGIKTDNRIENLEWCTHSENMKHAHKTGLVDHKRWSMKRSKLNDEQRIEILNSTAHTNDLAKKYGVSGETIYAVKRRRSELINPKG